MIARVSVCHECLANKKVRPVGLRPCVSVYLKPCFRNSVRDETAESSLKCESREVNLLRKLDLFAGKFNQLLSWLLSSTITAKKRASFFLLHLLSRSKSGLIVLLRQFRSSPQLQQYCAALLSHHFHVRLVTFLSEQSLKASKLGQR